MVWRRRIVGVHRFCTLGFGEKTWMIIEIIPLAVYKQVGHCWVGRTLASAQHCAAPAGDEPRCLFIAGRKQERDEHCSLLKVTL
jgi:hypothetical protein